MFELGGTRLIEKVSPFREYDVVLTTYPVVEAEWRRQVDKCKVKP